MSGERSTPGDVVRCGSCKWLTGGIEPHHLKKDGTVKERYNYTMFTCSVPFDPPKKIPACFELDLKERRWMAPSYGVGCPFHERRAA